MKPSCTFICLLFTLQAFISAGQDSSGVKNSFRRSFFEKGDIYGSLSYLTGRIADFDKKADGSINFEKPIHHLRSSIGINMGFRLFELVYLKTSLYYNINKQINAPWVITDYTYTVERTRWDRNSFSYGYTNYSANKYSGSATDFKNNFLRGQYYVRYFNGFPKKILKAIHVDTALDLTYSVSLKYSMYYLNNNTELTGGFLNGKPTLNLSLRQSILKNFYVEAGIEYYLRPSTKTHWDPDFTYGFGYNRYSNLTFAFAYINYSSNRFPWNKQYIKGYGFIDGILSVMLNFRW
jgi:hypothetical protein